MDAEVSLRAEPHRLAKKLIADGGRRIAQRRARNAIYSAGLFTSACLQAVLYLSLLWKSLERDGTPFDLLHHDLNVALIGLSFMPALAAIRRGDALQKVAALPLFVFPVGLAIHYVVWSLKLLRFASTGSWE